jgi:acetoacetyl-CoA synthetase
MWDASGLIHSGSYTAVVDTSAPMESIPHWFDGTYLNFAENVLFSADRRDASKTSTVGKEDGKVALTEIREGGVDVRDMTFGEVRRRVGVLGNALRAKGVKKGDRVALIAGTSFDTFIVFMAVLSLGALFSSSSTDMGSKGILERLLQIRPKFVFVDDWAVYNGKTVDLRPKMKEIVEGMRGVAEFEGLVVQPRFPGEIADISEVEGSLGLDKFLEAAGGRAELVFERVAFRDPFLIVYSSGTTGVPKCIVHGTGGVLISAMKEGLLHKELGPDNVMLQYTTVSRSHIPTCSDSNNPRRIEANNAGKTDGLDNVPSQRPIPPLRLPRDPLRRLALHTNPYNPPHHPRIPTCNRLRHLPPLPPRTPKTLHQTPHAV